MGKLNNNFLFMGEAKVPPSELLSDPFASPKQLKKDIKLLKKIQKDIYRWVTILKDVGDAGVSIGVIRRLKKLDPSGFESLPLSIFTKQRSTISKDKALLAIRRKLMSIVLSIDDNLPDLLGRWDTVLDDQAEDHINNFDDLIDYLGNINKANALSPEIHELDDQSELVEWSFKIAGDIKNRNFDALRKLYSTITGESLSTVFTGKETLDVLTGDKLINSIRSNIALSFGHYHSWRRKSNDISVVHGTADDYLEIANHSKYIMSVTVPIMEYYQNIFEKADDFYRYLN